ncbi:hypothetical protein [Carnobacterium sp. TMP28]|uniref:hypothetical protein n=1 Tax=Carnobacterium sp. TMP28 TaxID=3397060 RepID=UPI0039E1733A
MTEMYQKYSKLDKENNVAEVTFEVENKTIAIIRFDYNSDQTTFHGDINKFIKFESNEKYGDFVDCYRELGRYYLYNNFKNID